MSDSMEGIAIESLTIVGLEQYREELETDIAKIKTQVDTARSKAAANGDYSDNDWFISAKTALRHKGIAHQKVLRLLAERKRAERTRAHEQLTTLQSKLSIAEKALERSIVAIDDWLNIHASDHCDAERVREAERRINEFGTIGYIAEVQQQNRQALSEIRSNHERTEG